MHSYTQMNCFGGESVSKKKKLSNFIWIFSHFIFKIIDFIRLIFFFSPFFFFDLTVTELTIKKMNWVWRSNWLIKLRMEYVNGDGFISLQTHKLIAHIYFYGQTEHIITNKTVHLSAIQFFSFYLLFVVRWYFVNDSYPKLKKKKKLSLYVHSKWLINDLIFMNTNFVSIPNAVNFREKLLNQQIKSKLMHFHTWRSMLCVNDVMISD